MDFNVEDITQKIKKVTRISVLFGFIADIVQIEFYESDCSEIEEKVEENVIEQTHENEDKKSEVV